MKGIRQGFVAVIYLILMTLLYCSFTFKTVGIYIGGFHILYFYIAGICVILLAVICFLVCPNVSRGILLTKYSVILSILYFSSIFFSLIVWIAEKSATEVIIRGIFVAVYQLIAVLVAASALYLFGEKGIFLDFTAIIITYLIAAFRALSLGGIGSFIQEFYRLMITFSLETGPLMTIMENVNLQFSLGIYIVYFIVSAKESKRKHITALILAIIFLTVSIKRIVLVSAIISSILGLILRSLPKKMAKKTVLFLCGLLGMGAYVYVWLIGNGLFNWVDEQGVDTMARVYMYEDIRPYYTLDISHIGRGLGFVTKMLETGIVTFRAGVTDIHNDLLRQYIEQGFFGFLIWAYGLFYIRVIYFMRKHTDYGIVVFAIIVNSFITYMADNTYVLFFPNITTALTVMAYQFDKMADKER